MSYAKQVPAAARTLRLLELLATSPQGLSAGELADKLEISRSSMFALLNTLKAKEYIEQTNDRRYRAGSALFRLTPSQQRNRQSLIDAFHTDIEISALRETVAITRLDGLETVVVAQQESSHPVRSVLSIGQRRPLFTSADGLVLLAGLSSGAVEHTAPRQTAPQAGTLRQVKQTGLAQIKAAEVVEVACPICPDGYHPDSALLMSVPAFRWKGDAFIIQAMQNIAARLSFRVGAPVYQPYKQFIPEWVEPTTPLSGPELSQFLKGAWGARLACVRKDGTPHVVPLWYEWDGEFFWVTASPSASWASTIRENSWVALTIDEPWPPLRRVLVSGEAQPVTDSAVPGGLASLKERLAARYPGQNTDTLQTGQQGWEAFKIIPKKVIGQRGLTR